MNDNQQQIHKKGFDLSSDGRDYDGPLNYGSIKVGPKKIEDAVLDLGSIKKANRQFGDKYVVLQAMGERNLPLMREISNYFYNTNGIYSRVCDYFAFLYRYDWYIVPEVFDTKIKTDKILSDFYKVLNYLDNSHIKKLFGDIALEVIKNGAYYGYVVDSNDKLILQQLPINYCRSFYSVGNTPAVEFDMRFFDEQFRRPEYRAKILKLFPPEFQKGYMLYKQGKLEPDYEHADLRERPYHEGVGSRYSAGSWYLLDPEKTVKFSFSNGDQPLFINAVPAILDLDAAQDLDRRKQMQKLLKILVQKLPMDKNGDLIFDVDEARDIHNNAVEMLQHAVGVDIITTFADIDSIDISDSNTTTTKDDLAKVERSVYNAFGTSRNLFNTDGNLALEKSILDDESTMRTILLQFHEFLDSITQKMGNNRKKYNFKFYMLETTQYNYKELAKTYKEQVQVGYSKMLPQIAMGHSQSSILHTAYFENQILDLGTIMIPPLMSSTMNMESMQLAKEAKDNAAINGSDTGGRPEKPMDEKSEKTLQNIEAMS